MKGMMMEAPAPYVSVGGSGKIGIKNVDDSSKPDDVQFKLIRPYKVTFDSTGTTDGGLMFVQGYPFGMIALKLMMVALLSRVPICLLVEPTVPGSCSSVAMIRASIWLAVLALPMITSLVGMTQPLPCLVHLEIPNTG